MDLFDLPRGLTVDLFAGGGGASSGIEWATGRSPDIAINHDAQAVSLHKANHPGTKHYVSDVFTVDPLQATKGQPVALLWASPDCTHHSKARGAAPNRDKKRRALAWVVTRWAGQVMPSVIMLENVQEFADWGPLIGPADNRQPCPRRKGKTFRQWVKSLEQLGYEVE
jgi:DNA (cytosine-5)-methyltransferase 1